MAVGAWIIKASDPGMGRHAGRPLQGEIHVPQRIISLAVNTDEILLSLVPRERVVGVSIYATDPVKSYVWEEASGIQSLERDNADAILALKPDLVLMSSMASKDVEQLIAKAAVKVIRVPSPKDVEGIRSNVRLVAASVGATEKGEDLIADMDRRFAELEQLNGALSNVGAQHAAPNISGDKEGAVRGAPTRSESPAPSALYYTPSGWVSGRQSTLDIVIKAAGLRNAAAAIEGHKQVSQEWLIGVDPDVLLINEGYKEFEGFAERLKTEKAFSTLKAVKTGKILRIEARELVPVSHFIARASENLRGRLCEEGVVPRPQRVAALTLNASEILLDLLPTGRLVALHESAASDPSSNIRERAQGLPRVGTDAEALLLLKPDLVITASYSKPEFIVQLDKAKLPVARLTRFSGLSSIYENIERLGNLVGEPARATAMITTMRRRIEGLRASRPMADKPFRVLSLDVSGTVAGRGTLFGELIELAGAVNVAAEHNIEGFGTVSAEQVQVWNPDVIVVGGDVQEEPLFKTLMNRRILRLDPSRFTCASQYIVMALHDLMQALYE